MISVQANAYWSVMSARFRVLLQYRTVALAGIVTQLFFGFVRVMIYDGFYRSTSLPQPMTYQQVVSYVWLSQAMLLLVMLHVEPEIASMIRTGVVAYELTRPIDLYGLWFARCFSARAAPLLMRSIPILLIAALFCGLQPPVSLGALALFSISILAGLLLAAALVTLISITLLWTISGDGIARMAPAMVFFFSGIVIPLPLFPGWAQPIFNLLPFRGLIDVPFRIYLGNMTTTAALLSIAQQFVWIGAFIGIGRWTLNRGMRRLVVQGG